MAYDDGQMKRSIDGAEGEGKRMRLNEGAAAQDPFGGSVFQPLGMGMPANQISMRVLIDTKHAGLVIGPKGCTIKQFRETSQARIELSEAVPEAKKRVVTVEANLESVCLALHLLADCVRNKLPQDLARPETQESFITLLVDVKHVGAILGKAGDKINVTRQSSGANIKVSDQPLDFSSEKTVSIRGLSSSVQNALTIIALQLFESMSKGGVATQYYRPMPEVASNPFAALGAFDLNQLAAGGGFNGQNFLPQFAQQGMQGMYGMPNQGYVQPFQNAGGAQETVNLQVPEIIAGSLIGKAGSVINEIRRLSGATIKMGPNVPGADRTLTITGNSFQKDQALGLVQTKIIQIQSSPQPARRS